MKKIITAVVAATILAFAAAPAEAGKGKKKREGGKAATAGVFNRFDADKNGTLEAAEVTALQDAFKGGDASLKSVDTNSDGKLDENEVAALKPGEGKGKKAGKAGKKGGKKKKKAAAQ